MTTTAPLDPQILYDAADLVATPGVWVQGDMDDGEHVCAHGAVLRQHCTPGDQHLWRAVMRQRGATEWWNDATGRTADEVAARLRQIAADVTVDDMETAFGSQWEAIRALVRRAAVLTVDEAKQLAAAWDAAWDAIHRAAWAAARVAAWDAARAAAWDAAWDAARDAAWAAAWGAAWDATLALVVRDLIGQHGFTQTHYDLLTGPWATVIGPVHPDDASPLR